jgi:hypothetical protein
MWVRTLHLYVTQFYEIPKLSGPSKLPIRTLQLEARQVLPSFVGDGDGMQALSSLTVVLIELPLQ